MKTTKTTFDHTEEEQPEKRYTFTLKSDTNIERAERLLRDLGIRFRSEESGQSLEFSFAAEWVRDMARRCVRKVIDCATEAREWAK